MNSPLQLIHRTFITIELHAQAVPDSTDGFQLSHLHSVARDEDEPTHWSAKFGVRLEDNSEEDPARYVGEIVVVGTFELAKEFPEDKAEQMVYLNSGAILYGAIRELVLTLTSQSIHGELNLPTIDARSFIPEGEVADNSPNVG